MYINLYHHLKHLAMFLSAAVVSMATVGCSQNIDADVDNPSINRDGTVVFGAYVSNSNSSRATVSNIHSLKKNGFGAFAALTWDEDFQDTPSGGFKPNYIYNKKVEWKKTDSSSDSAWVYEPVMLWPGMMKVSFFAYAPYGSTAIKSLSEANEPGSPKLTFSLDKNWNNHVDLLYANAMNLVNNPQVMLTFKHALSRININLKKDDVDSNTSLSINKLTFKSTDLGTAGELNLATGQWTKISGSTEYVITSLDDLKNSFMVIPPGKDATMEIIADYTITTVDPKLPDGSFKSSRVISHPVDINFQAGKAYIINLHINLNSVKVNTKIVDWDDVNYTWESDQDHQNKLE